MQVKRLTWTADKCWNDDDAGRLFRPDLVLYFGATEDLRDGRASQALAARYPGAIRLGCSTGTQVAGDRLDDTGASALVLGLERTRLRLTASRASMTRLAIPLATRY